MPERYALLVLLGAGTGLRQGEAFGLALDRVDTSAGMITVNQQVIVVRQRPMLGAPKTSSSVRDVPMPDFVQEAIAEQTERLRLGGGDVLCRTAKGTLFRRDYYNRYIWKPAVQAAGLMADTTFHDLRHTFASTALAEGVPISEVSRWLGHKSITTTVDLYGNSRELHQAGEETAGQQVTGSPDRCSGRPDAGLLAWEDTTMIPSDARSAHRRACIRREIQNRSEEGTRGIVAGVCSPGGALSGFLYLTPPLHLVPEASGRARDALDRAFARARMCPESAPAAT